MNIVYGSVVSLGHAKLTFYVPGLDAKIILVLLQ